MKSRSTAVILALLLGGIGIHRFYLGETWIGLFYLLFCWTFIPLFFSIIDFFCFLFMSDLNFNRRYNFTRIKVGYYSEAELDNNYEDNSKVLSSEIEKLHQLKEKGILSESEFQKAKSKLL
ncbi:NINE protein [Sphingobacterium humi]|uniref:NINE protein n=1 Tax=Sphingobacterium humi TaxID=1796905 RepID=A0A6N8KYA9_9SPHI|nr:NINE protein [Sphingobacterium humi]MVZ60918.1 NINE protein [Sphingobacterium humi]